MPLEAGALAAVMTVPGAALTSKVDEVAEAVRVPIVRRLPKVEVPTGSIEMTPPPVPVVTAPNVWETARPDLPENCRTPLESVTAEPAFGVPRRYGCEALSAWPEVTVAAALSVMMFPLIAVM